MLDKFIPKRSGDDYANLVTVFAVILAVEYSSDRHDTWDILVGLLAISLGIAFVKDAINYKDGWFSFLTASLISLGIVVALSALLFIFAQEIGKATELDLFISSTYDLFRVLIFLGLTFWCKWKLIDAK